MTKCAYRVMYSSLASDPVLKDDWRLVYVPSKKLWLDSILCIQKSLKICDSKLTLCTDSLKSVQNFRNIVRCLGILVVSPLT